jgi:hypothetical protein
MERQSSDIQQQRGIGDFGMADNNGSNSNGSNSGGINGSKEASWSEH